MYDLTTNPPLEAVEVALRSLRRNVNGGDPLRRIMIRGAAIQVLQGVLVDAPARHVDAALGSGAAHDGNAQGRAIALTDPEPWDEPVDGALLLTDLLDVFRRYLILPK